MLTLSSLKLAKNANISFLHKSRLTLLNSIWKLFSAMIGQSQFGVELSEWCFSWLITDQLIDNVSELWCHAGPRPIRCDAIVWNQLIQSE